MTNLNAGTTMDYHQMSIVELKRVAKERRIKQYYVKKRHELIQILSYTELPLQYRVEKLTIHELRDQAKEQNIPHVYKLNRAQLVDILYPTLWGTEKKDEDDNGTEKHDNPKQSNTK